MTLRGVLRKRENSRGRKGRMLKALGAMSVQVLDILGLSVHHFRICDYKNVQQNVDKLDAAMKVDMQQTRHTQELSEELNALNQSLSRSDLHYRDRSALSEKQTRLQERLKSMTRLCSTGKPYLEPAHFGNVRGAWEDKLELAPPPIDGEWLPKSAVYALVDLMVVIFGRPKGLFKECGKRIQSGMHTVQEELVKLGITESVREVDLQHSAIWMAGVYLMLLMQFLENKVAIELTRSEFVEAQEDCQKNSPLHQKVMFSLEIDSN